jgi:ferrous iron transport protein B
LTKAGTTIFCLSVVLWAMSYYPRLPESRTDEVQQAAMTHWQQANVPYGCIDGKSAKDLALMGEQVKTAGEQAVAAAQSEYSISGRLGHLMEPAIRPLGFDWKMGVGLVSAFAAREVFVSSMGIIYSTGDTEEGGTASLADAMRADHYATGARAGKPVWTPLVAISLLVWFVLAMQCISTVAIVRRETGGWGWPIFMIVYMNALAYVASLAVFQIGRMIVGA